MADARLDRQAALLDDIVDERGIVIGAGLRGLFGEGSFLRLQRLLARLDLGKTRFGGRQFFLGHGCFLGCGLFRKERARLLGAHFGRLADHVVEMPLRQQLFSLLDAFLVQNVIAHATEHACHALDDPGRGAIAEFDVAEHHGVVIANSTAFRPFTAGAWAPRKPTWRRYHLPGIGLLG